MECVFDEEEILFWSERVRAFDFKSTRGFIWVIWGIEWCDVLLMNVFVFDDVVGEFVYDWYGMCCLCLLKLKSFVKLIAALFVVAF